MADFETTTAAQDKYSTRVWGWGVVNIDNHNDIHIGHTIEEFFALMYRLNNPVVYFHNLKFDGEFILSYLLHNGFEHSPKAKDMSFSTTISDTMMFYEIEVIWKRNKYTNRKVKFLDSMKKLPFSVARIGKAFNLDTNKLEVHEGFYDEIREEGHQLTDLEIEYIKADILVIAQALKIQFDQGLDKMTIGSDALTNFQGTMGGKNIFEYNFPVFDKTVDKDIRQSYKGGVVWVNPKYEGKEIGANTSYDVVSLYPSVMYDELLPFGVPLLYEGMYEYDRDYPLYIQKLEVSFDLKEGHMPTIQIKDNPFFMSTEYIETTNDEPVMLYLTSIDLVLLHDHYDIHFIEYHKGWKFAATTGFFTDYIDHWLKLKETSTGAMRELAKLMLNSLYGKFATNPDVTGKIPYLDYGVVHYDEEEETLRDPVYTAMGSFITSYARDKTIRTAQKVFDRFIYCDTDSIHLEGLEIPDIEIGSKLGQWECEGKFTRAKFLRAKTYIKDDGSGKLSVTGAGMPDVVKEQVTWENFTMGFNAFGKLKPRRVFGGVVLEPTTFTIQW